jgi:hypothetical protein
MRSILILVCIAATPVALSAQGLQVSRVIPTQTLRPARISAFPALTWAADAAPLPTVVRYCNMPVARASIESSTQDGGLTLPANRAIPILNAGSGCVNGLATPVSRDTVGIGPD